MKPKRPQITTYPSSKKLSAGEEKGRCGWLKDKFGLSWQTIPAALGSPMSDPDPGKVPGSFHAKVTMDKIDVAALQRTHDQK
jgi:predicted 3-demethylubiquinone-9 3-methyltransferase (glyoxalase superfamily)